MGRDQGGGLIVAHEQAFHTCCRNGLTSSSLAFQWEACSPGLDDSMLSAIARRMVGYTPPPGAPPAPEPEELDRFPVSLRYDHVEGVGPCVSRTVYVGREDRGNGGSGRFGNYFSHVLVAPGAACFDERLHPIELWDAELWTTDETEGTAVDRVEIQQPAADGALRAFDALRRAERIHLLPAVIDGLARALDGATRVVVLDEPHHSQAWIAAAVACLPSSLAARITFDTFTAEPDRSVALLAVGSPDVARAALAHRVHTGDVVLVDAAEADAPAPVTLLGRATQHYVGLGQEGRVSELGAATTKPLAQDRYAAVLALASGDESLVQADDLGSILEQLTDWLVDGAEQPVELAEAAAVLRGFVSGDIPNDRVAGGGRVDEVLAAALRSSVPGSDEVASALTAFVIHAIDTVEPRSLPRIPNAAEAFELLGDALDRVSDSTLDAPTTARRVAVLHALGLIGVNAEIDRAAGRLCGHHLADDAVRSVAQDLAGAATARRCLEHALWYAAAAATRHGRALPEPVLAELADPPIGQILVELGTGPDRLPAALLSAQARLARGRGTRHAELEKLLRAFGEESRAELMRALYPGGVRSADDLVQVLTAHAQADVEADPDLIAAAWDSIAEANPFDPPATLLEALRRQPRSAPHPAEAGIELAAGFPRGELSMSAWIDDLARHLDRLPAAHVDALAERVARFAANVRGAPLHREIGTAAAAVLARDFTDRYERELERRFARDQDPDRAFELFQAWYSPKVPEELRSRLVDESLPRVLETWKPSAREELGDVFRAHGARASQFWARWQEDHPSAGAIGRVFKRRRQARSE